MRFLSPVFHQKTPEPGGQGKLSNDQQLSVDYSVTSPHRISSVVPGNERVSTGRTVYKQDG